jgi:GTP cyclohydrolase IA
MPVDRPQAALAIESFLRALGRDPAKEPELKGTGERVAHAFADDLCKGYELDVDALFSKNVILVKTGKTEVVALRDIAVATMCPHHLMPATGFGTVAFAPRGKLLGLGAIAELMDGFSRRLTLQEAIGDHVADALMAHLEPVWAGCRIVLTHTCLTARGERRWGSLTETVALAGSPNAEDRAAAMAALGVGR